MKGPYVFRRRSVSVIDIDTARASNATSFLMPSRTRPFQVGLDQLAEHAAAAGARLQFVANASSFVDFFADNAEDESKALTAFKNCDQINAFFLELTAVRCGVCVCVCVRACARARVRACVRTGGRADGRTGVRGVRACAARRGAACVRVARWKA